NFNMCELAAFDFGELRADLVLGGIDGRVEHIARSLLAEFPEGTEIARESLAQRIPPPHEDLPEVGDSLFACHRFAFFRSFFRSLFHGVLAPHSHISALPLARQTGIYR